MASIADVLSWVPLTEAVETIRGGLPRPLTDPFYTIREEFSGNVASYVDWVGTRQVARMQPYGAPPQPTNKLSLSSTNVVMLNFIEYMTYQEEMFRILRQWEEYKPQQMFFLRNLMWQGEEFARRFENAETAAINGTIANATLWFDSTGNMLPSSSGAFTSVPQGVPTTNTGTLNGLLTGSFADPNYDIVTFINQKFKVRALEDTNYPSRTAVHGANIPGYFANNTYTKLAWGYQSEYALPYLRAGAVPPKFCDMTWINASEMYYQDATATNQLLFPPDQITFMPEITSAFWTVYVGSTLIPAFFGPTMGAVEQLKNGFAEKFGRWRYAWIPQGTSSLVDQAGYPFIPRVKVPLAMYLLDTTA